MNYPDQIHNPLPASVLADVDAAMAGIPADPAAPGAADTTPAPELPPGQMAQQIATSLVSGLCVIAVPNWGVAPEEQRLVAEPLSIIAQAWLPKSANSVPNPWVALVIGATMIAAPRLMAGIPARLPPREADDQHTQEAA